MMPTIERLCLEDALDDTPQMRSLLRLFEEDTSLWKEHTTEYQASCQRLCNAQLEVYEATKNLAMTVKKIETKNFPVGRDNSQLKASMAQFYTFLSELSLVQRAIVNQISDGFLKPLNRLINKDLQVLAGLITRYQVVSEETDTAGHTYLRLSTRSSPECLREAADDLAQMRRKRHTTALQYYGGLNVLQYRFRQALLSSVTGGLTGLKAASRQWTEPMQKPRLEEFVHATESTVVELTQGLDSERDKCEELGAALREHHVSLYSPIVTDQLSPPCLTLGYKAGYLAQRVKGGLLGQQTRWTLTYFFTQAGNLMAQGKDELAGSLVADLNEDGVYIETGESDDRRNIFLIHVPSQKRAIILQAESDRQRQEWIATISNVIRESGYVKRKTSDNATTDSAVTESSASPARSTSSLGGSSLQSWLVAQPIQFDLETSLLPGTRLNPFNPLRACDANDSSWIRDAPVDDGQEALENSGDNSSQSDNTDAAPESLTMSPRVIDSFTLRFIGCVRVPNATGEELVTAVLRHIMGARAAHNLFRMTDLTCEVRTDGLSLLDADPGGPRTALFPLNKVTYWCSHRENNRLFGMISGPEGGSPPKGFSSHHSYLCHAFECDDGNEISRAIRCAIKLSDPKKSEETALLLANIDQLPDIGNSGEESSPSPTNHSNSNHSTPTRRDKQHQDDAKRVSTA